MLNTGKFAALAILSLLATNPAIAGDKSAAMVNGVSIPQERIDKIVKTVVESQGQKDTPELRKKIREGLINKELVLQEVRDRKLDKEPEVMEQIELTRHDILINAFQQDHLKNHPVSEDQLKQEYEKLKNDAGEKEFNTRHILVDTEAEAKEIIAKLGKKGSFDKLAKQKSKDTGSAEKGGSLGWAIPGNFVPPFASAMVKLKKGEYTKEPVESQFGWHVIKIDDVRNLKLPSYEELKPQMQQRLQQQSIISEIDKLRAKAKIE